LYTSLNFKIAFDLEQVLDQKLYSIMFVDKFEWTLIISIGV